MIIPFLGYHLVITHWQLEIIYIYRDINGGYSWENPLEMMFSCFINPLFDVISSINGVYNLSWQTHRCLIPPVLRETQSLGNPDSWDSPLELATKFGAWVQKSG